MRIRRKALISIGNVQESEKASVLAAEVLKKLEIAFPRCMGIKKKVIPMQHGSAKSDFFDTSSARMLV